MSDQLVTPMPTANPPITIGPFTNVPAPGSPIRSDWAQQITTYVTDRVVIPFTSTADRDAKWPSPPNGAMCTTADTGWVWTRRAGVWVPLSASVASTVSNLGAFPAGFYSWPAADGVLDLGAPMFTGGLTSWAGLWTITASMVLTTSDTGNVDWKLIYGASGGVYTAGGGTAVWAAVAFTSSAKIAAGQQILWRFNKAANTAAWPTCGIRFNVSYQSG